MSLDPNMPLYTLTYLVSKLYIPFINLPQSVLSSAIIIFEVCEMFPIASSYQELLSIFIFSMHLHIFSTLSICI